MMAGIALFSSNVAKSILRKLDSEAVASSSHQVEKLRDSVTRICQMLEAEGVDNRRDWIKKVSNALYEADDLVDGPELVVERLDMVSSLTQVLKQLTSLEELEISSCKDLDLSGGCQRSCGECDECGMPWKSLSTLRRLTLRELTKLETLPVGLGFIGTLKTICISACNNFSVLPEWVNKFTSLQHLRLEGCPALSELPEKLKEMRSLVKVDIIECPKLMERCRKGGEDWHKIKHARVLCQKSWRYALMSEAELPQKPKNQEVIAVHSEDPTIHLDVTVRRHSNRKM